MSAVGDRHDLRLTAGGRSYRFAPRSRVTVGTDPAADVVVEDSLVDRFHAEFRHDGERWHLSDLGSRHGTFVDGKRLRRAHRVAGAFWVHLGDDDAGAEVRVVAAGIHRRPHSLPRPALAAVAAAALVVGGSAIYAVATSGGSSPERVAAAPAGPTPPPVTVQPAEVTRSVANSPDELSRAKAATVLLVTDRDGDAAAGSGAFVSDRYVLTNRHVAREGERVRIAVNEREDEPAVFRYEGRTVAEHPFLDVALVELERELDADRTPGPIVTRPPGVLPLADSRPIRAGQEINSLGYPAIAADIVTDERGDLILPSVVVAGGDVASFDLWPACGNERPHHLPAGYGVDCSTVGDLPRGNLVSTDLSGSGGSGGPVVVAGELVAVRYAVRTEAPGQFSTAGVARSIPTEYFLDWIVPRLG